MQPATLLIGLQTTTEQNEIMEAFAATVTQFNVRVVNLDVKMWYIIINGDPDAEYIQARRVVL